ncbi:hypothetical protein C8F04DRAFT_1255779 [Mycena alexandri]|nr:hypothetical protein C8F04DRAFT_1255779 [Mycena alexandri]
MYSYSIAIEDGAFIGKIFPHTRDPARIPEFFSAFEENRWETTVPAHQQVRSTVDIMALPFMIRGPMQAERDAAMRGNKAAGRNVIDAGEAHLQDMWDDMRMVHVPALARPTYTHGVLSFGYDPADDADDWWMSWRQLRDAPNAPKRVY